MCEVTEYTGGRIYKIGVWVKVKRVPLDLYVHPYTGSVSTLTSHTNSI